MFHNLFSKKVTDEFVGIALYSAFVRVVRLRKKTDSQELVCFHAEQYPLEQPDQLPAVLQNIIEDQKLEGTNCVLVIPPERVESVQIEMSELPTADVQASLPWKLKELVSIPPQDMICDFIEMDIQPLGQQPKAQIMATSRSYVETIIEPFHKANVPIVGITTEQFVLAKMQSLEDVAQLIFVQHKEMAGILLILKNQQICFARKIRGTDSVINMMPEQIREYGADMIAIEIQRSIDYYESQLKQPPIKDVLLAVAGENEALVADILNSNLPVKTRTARGDSDIEDETGKITLAYLAALGGALYAHQEESN